VNLAPTTENYQVQDMNIQFTNNNFLGKGKTCFGYQSYPNPDLLVWFETDNPETLITIGTPISSDKIAGGTWVDGVWWCCEYSASSNSNIWTIDHVTGDMTLLGVSGEGLHGLAYDDITGTMYACGATNLFTIDMATGTAILVGSFGISGSVMIGIASDGYGNMYGEDLHTDSFYSIDPTTGAATLIGPLGLDLNHGQDMAIDKEDGTCYLAAFTVHAGDEGALYICDLTTGSPTKIGNLGTVPTSITGFVIPYSLNEPPDKPEIEGQRRFKEGEGGEYPYTIFSTDSEGDDVYYCINWSDGTIDWFGPYESGEEITINVTIPLEKGTYVLFKVKAKDIFDAESDWAILEVTVPKSQNMWFLRWLERFPILNQIVNLLMEKWI